MNLSQNIVAKKPPLEIYLLGDYYDTFKFDNGMYQGKFGYANLKFIIEVANGIHKDYMVKEV